MKEISKFGFFLRKIVFGRAVLTVLLILLQVFFFFACFYWLSEYWPVISVFLVALSVFLVIYVVNRDQNPAFKLTWVMLMCAFPLFGGLLYLYVQTNLPTYGIRKYINLRIDETKVFLQQDQGIRKELNLISNSMKAISSYVENVGYYPTYGNTEVVYFPSGRKKFEDLMTELKKAEKYIFLEYFIVSQGYMWSSILEILKEKVKQGVEVKLLIDGTCFLYHLPRHYDEETRKYGIDTRVFLPVKPVFSTYQNNRDHRKILVIDGKVAYNGGINLADEYMGKKVLYGYWKDTAVRLKGPAVRSFVIMFLQMWYVSGKQKRRNFIPGEYEKYLQDVPEMGANRKKELGYVMFYGDGPNTGHNIAENVYLDIMNRSNRYVHIMTPYFINDNEVIRAFKYAAERGTDVKLIMPGKPDKHFAYDIARTYYPTLLKAGVEVYEFTPGFVHAKQFVSDDNKAIVGSINLDFRSLYHHFECATYIYRNPVVKEIEEDFQKTLKQCKKVTMEYYKSIPLMNRVTGQILKLFAPIF